MSIFLFCIAGGLFVLLVLLAATRPTPAEESLFELRRRQRIRDKRASDALRRRALLAQVAVLYRPLQAVVLVLLTAILFYLLGWMGGLSLMLCIALSYGRVAQIPFVQRFANGVYRRNEQTFLGLVSKHKKTIRFIGGRKAPEEETVPLGSREELVHVVELSPVFSQEDKRLLRNAFRFKERPIEDLMTPRNKVVTVVDSELLGPLVLDDLHKTGHTIFPVVKGEVVVGLLDSSDHVDLHTKESVHVRSVMHTDITKVGEDTTLEDALRALLATKEQLLIVVGDDEQMTGIVSLKDLVRAIVG